MKKSRFFGRHRLALILACGAFALIPLAAPAQQVGNTNTTTLPFVAAIYRPCWNCTVNLDPAQLFYTANPKSPFLDATLMARVRALSAKQSAAGIVPTAGLQRWEDTYEASFPSGTFPGEPAWIKADRKAGNLPNLPEFVAWRNFVTEHSQYADVAFDGGTMPPQANYFRSWGGQWGYISPLTPLDAADCPPSTPKNCTWGDSFAYRFAQTSKITGGYGLQLSDFTDGQPYVNTLHDFNARIVSAFGDTLPGGSVPGTSPASQAEWINQNAFSDWTDYLDRGYAAFYAALATQVSTAAGHAALVIDQCSISPSIRRTEGVDERLIAQALSPDNYMCIWDDQIIQVGRSGPLATPPIGEMAGAVLAAAREPKIRNGANIEADDAAYWSAIASFYPSLPAASQQEVGIKLLKRLWVWQSWAHIADRTGAVRRALAFASRDYWDVGSLAKLGIVSSLIHQIVPVRPFGLALYYSVAVERAVETAGAAAAAPGDGPNTYLMPADIQALLDGGVPLGYYVSDAALPEISAAAGNAPTAWVVPNAGDALPAKELAALRAIAPVVTTQAQFAALRKQALELSPGLSGFGFWAQNGKLVVVVSNPSPAANAGSVSGTVQIAWTAGKTVHVRELQTGAALALPVVNGIANLPVSLTRWDTSIFAITG